MQTTKKYPEIFTEVEKNKLNTSISTDTHQQVVKNEALDREVLVAEIKAMIAKAYSADESNNSQS